MQPSNAKNLKKKEDQNDYRECSTSKDMRKLHNVNLTAVPMKRNHVSLLVGGNASNLSIKVDVVSVPISQNAITKQDASPYAIKKVARTLNGVNCRISRIQESGISIIIMTTKKRLLLTSQPNRTLVASYKF